MDQSTRCAHCRRTIDVGMDAFGCQQGVQSFKRFVPLEDMNVLCSRECLCSFYKCPPKMPERIP